MKIICTIWFAVLFLTMALIIGAAYTEALTVLDYVVLMAFALGDALLILIGFDAYFDLDLI